MDANTTKSYTFENLPSGTKYKIYETDKYGNKIIYIPVKDVKNVDTDKGYVGAICRYMKISAMRLVNGL